MKEKKFSPFLAPNMEADLKTIKYPVLASYKLDGIRCIFKDGQMLSRSLKQIQNKQLQDKFQPLKNLTKDTNLILDGEIYSHERTFQEITSIVMTKDKPVPSDILFYCFDSVQQGLFEQPFYERKRFCLEMCIKFVTITKMCHQFELKDKEDIEAFFKLALEKGYEGLILKDPCGNYKCGRGTVKEGLIYKVKPYRTFDAEVIGVTQATKVDPDAEKTVNELGGSVTSNKKDDRILVDKASAFVVKYGEHELKVSIALPDDQKRTIWANKSEYIGKTIEYKGMLIGAKDVPRHPVYVRFRKDKDTDLHYG